MKEIEIQPMQASHLAEVLAIENDVFPAPWTEGMFRQEMSHQRVSRLSVVIRHRKVVGYYIAWFLEDMVHLVNIAVARPFHRKGIGSVCLERILDEATQEGRRYIVLEVRGSNRSALEFYHAFHFEKVGVRKRYYSDNFEDAILMALDLVKHPFTKGMK
ncbi:MAG: ribosomal protein S18-alanine N-acetyltransferase [Candidatus Latescibacterota bacterium]